MHRVHLDIFATLTNLVALTEATHVYINFDFPEDRDGRPRSVSYSLGDLPTDVTFGDPITPSDEEIRRLRDEAVAGVKAATPGTFGDFGKPEHDAEDEEYDHGEPEEKPEPPSRTTPIEDLIDAPREEMGPIEARFHMRGVDERITRRIKDDPQA